MINSKLGCSMSDSGLLVWQCTDCPYNTLNKQAWDLPDISPHPRLNSNDEIRCCGFRSRIRGFFYLWIRDKFLPDYGSWIPNKYLWQLSKICIYFQFCEIYSCDVRQLIFFPQPPFVVFGSEVCDPGKI
jgi:hypothetical protein